MERERKREKEGKERVGEEEGREREGKERRVHLLPPGSERSHLKPFSKLLWQ